MIVSDIADQDLGEPVDFANDAVDLSVLLATDRDFGQRSRRRWRIGRRGSRSLSAISGVMRHRDLLE